MKKSLTILAIAALCAPTLWGGDNNDGSISPEILQRLKASYTNSPADRALRNAMSRNDINELAQNADNLRDLNTDFSHKVHSKGITNQKSSGRCWLFTGLNVLRAQMMAEHDLAELQLSQNYNFFFDQLEKSNLFLQAIIDTAEKPIEDKSVEWLFKNPLSDGGQYTGISDNIMKYGIVPASAMPETYSSNNTSRISKLIGLKLKEFGLELRKMKATKSSNADIQARKEAMLSDVYRMLALSFGVPPTEFEWTRKNSKGQIIDRRTYTPLEFYHEYAGNNLKDDYVMLMNDPTREYFKLYEIEYDRQAYDGKNWTYVNLPIDEIKKMAIASIKDSTMMYFSCDVGQSFDRERGILNVNNYDYGSLFGTTFPMNKAERIRTFSSASSHAMTLMAVDIDKDGKPVKWMVENSWGQGANNGHLIMTDEWFDEFMFRLVVDKKYATKKTLEVLKQKPVKLPSWDPMFAEEL